MPNPHTSPMTKTLDTTHLVPGSDTHIQHVLEAKHRGVVTIHMKLGGTVLYSVSKEYENYPAPMR